MGFLRLLATWKFWWMCDISTSGFRQRDSGSTSVWWQFGQMEYKDYRWVVYSFWSPKHKIYTIVYFVSARLLALAAKKEWSYSIKSGYKLLCEDSSREEALSSSSATNMVFCYGIWKLKVPGNVNHFLWRACTNSLPTKVKSHEAKNPCWSIVSPMWETTWGYHACFVGL